MALASSAAPSEAEKAAIAAATARRASRSVRVETGLSQKADSSIEMGAPHADTLGWQNRLEDALGTRSMAFVKTETTQIVNFLRKNGSVDPNQVDAIFAVLDGAKPENEIEAMLVIQMAATHVLAMRSAAALNHSENIPQQDSNSLALTRLTKTFTAQVEALSKLRRGGTQKVTVEHVHVYEGGQAIVGSLPHSGGRGASLENGHQPHAIEQATTLALTECGPMPCQDPQREPLPVTCSRREETVSNARRRAGIRSANG